MATFPNDTIDAATLAGIADCPLPEGGSLILGSTSLGLAEHLDPATDVGHCAVKPPSAIRIAPLTKRERGEARKTTISAISSGSEIRPSGCAAAICASTASMSGAPARELRRNGVSIAPGRHRVHPDAARRPVDRELARELDDCALARAIGDLVGEPDDAGDGGDVDDRAAASVSRGSASRAWTNAPRTFVRSTASHSSSVVSSVGLSRNCAALLTRMSSLPNRSTASATACAGRRAVGDVADDGRDPAVGPLELGHRRA